MKHFDAVLAWTGWAIVVTGSLLFFYSAVNAQTDPPSVWQPADTPSYTVLRSQSLFNAEQDTVTGEYWTFDTTAHSGAKAAIGTATQWTYPMVRWSRTDLTWADEIWVWCKPATEQRCTFQFGSWRGRTNGYTVNVLPEWTLVRIPLFGIDAGNGAFDSIEDMYFFAESGALLVDDVWAVKLGPPPTEPTPDPTPEPEPTPDPEPTVTWGEWHFAGFEIIEERTSSDGQTQRRSSPLILKLGVPEVQP